MDCVFGLPGHGKSTLSLWLLRHYQERSGGWAFVGDGAARFPRTGTDGNRLSFIREHRTAADLERWLEGRPLAESQPLVHVCGDPDGLEVAWLAERVAKATGRVAFCWWDEIVFVDGANSEGRLNARLRRLYAVRIHARVHFGLCSQSPGWANKDLRRLATKIHLLRVEERADLDSLRDSGVPSSYLETCRKLPKYKKITYER